MPDNTKDYMTPEAMARAMPILKWMVGDARFLTDPDEVSATFIGLLRDSGLPLDRLNSALPTLYAERRGLGRQWTPEEGVQWVEYAWDNDDAYAASPYRQAHETKDWVRFRPDEVADDAFGIVPDLRADGITDYICMPVFFRDGTSGGMTFATRRPSGFSDEDIAVLRAIEGAGGTLMEVNRTWLLLRETLQMYVGAEPHERILAGQVRRGDVTHIRSAIVFADMRGFTALSEGMTGEETVALLNRYFDCVVPSIEAAGGEVLKYIGDGVLAIFRAATDGTGACRNALTAAREIVERVAADRADSSMTFDIKVALHVGDVAYGNIGSGARLDFTVVGGSVNLAARLADLCGPLDRRILVSADFAARLPEVACEDMGEHKLRGVAEAQQVLAPD